MEPECVCDSWVCKRPNLTYAIIVVLVLIVLVLLYHCYNMKKLEEQLEDDLDDAYLKFVEEEKREKMRKEQQENLHRSPQVKMGSTLNMPCPACKRAVMQVQSDGVLICTLCKQKTLAPGDYKMRGGMGRGAVRGDIKESLVSNRSSGWDVDAVY